MEHKKIYLINPINEGVVFDALFPMSLLFLWGYLYSKEIDVSIIDLRQCKINEPEKWNLPLDGDIYGITACTAQINSAQMAAEYVKTKDNIVILGGPHGQLFPEWVLKNTVFDAVCLGEGEQVLEDLLSLPLWKVNGIAYNDRNNIIMTPSRSLADRDEFPFPPIKELNDIALFKIWLNKHGEWIETDINAGSPMFTRGCKYNCAFCGGPHLCNRKVQCHSIDYMKKWIQYLIEEVKCQILTFFDATIFVDKEKLIQLCRVLNEFSIPWSAMIRADQGTYEILNIMKSNGCVQVGVGLESGSQRMLDIVHKGTTIEQNGEIIQNCNDLGLIVSGDFIYGFPGETEKDFNATLDFIQKYPCDAYDAAPFIPLPGCDVFDKPDKYNYKFLNYDEINDDYHKYLMKPYIRFFKKYFGIKYEQLSQGSNPDIIIQRGNQILELIKGKSWSSALRKLVPNEQNSESWELLFEQMRKC